MQDLTQPRRDLRVLRRWVEVTAVAHDHAIDDAPLGWVIVLRDVSEEHRQAGRREMLDDIAGAVASCQFDLNCADIPDPDLVNFYFDGLTGVMKIFTRSRDGGLVPRAPAASRPAPRPACSRRSASRFCTLTRTCPTPLATSSAAASSRSWHPV